MADENLSILKTALDLVKRDTAALPPGTKGAFVAYTDGKKVTFAAVANLGSGFHLSARLESKLSKLQPEGYLGITKTW